jgi:hypothetical protein
MSENSQIVETFYSLINTIEATEALHPYVPGFLKFSLAALIVLLSFLPVSILSYILSWSFGNILIQASSSLEKISHSVHKTSLSCWARSRKIAINLYDQYSLFINYENPQFRTDGIPAQAALDKIREDIPRFGDRIILNNNNNASLVEEFNNQLNDFNDNTKSMIEEARTVRELEVPQLDIDPSIEHDRKSAIAIMAIMGPLMLMAAGANSFLLSDFFSQLGFITKLFFGIKLYHALAVMFTLIEIGIGVQIARQELDASKGIAAIGFLWTVTALLAFIEMGIYSILAVNISSDGDAQVGEVIANLSIQTFFQYQLWLTFLGPAIVLCLALFGKSFAGAYFKLMGVSQLAKIDTLLDKLFSRQTEVIEEASALESQSNVFIEKFNNENIRLDNLEPTEEQWSRVANDWIELIQQTQNSINESSNFEYESPSFHSEDLDRSEAARIAHTKLLYALIPLACLPVLSLILPNNYSFAGTNISFFGVTLLISFVIIGTTYLSGYLCTRQQNIFRKSDNDSSQLIQSKSSSSEFLAGFLIIAGAFAFLAYTFYFNSSNPSLSSLGLSLLILGICFYSGRELMHAVPALIILASSLTWKIAAFFNSLLSYMSIFFSRIVIIIEKTLWGTSFPIRHLMGN